jgi:pyruvate-ferredoxin/flavodoxin oxidoreductase
MSSTQDFPFPGIPNTRDGGEAVVYVETYITDGACAYPITSSSKMGEEYAKLVADGFRNLWGAKLAFMELESEHSAASTCEGFALAGGRVCNFTSGQGLILMKEVLYTISGKRLPIVFHIGARALTSHSLNVHAGHDDVMGVADCGWGMIFAKNAQEAGDFALISRRVAEDTDTPFFNVQDGFLTTHTVESVFDPEPEMMKQYIGHSSEKLLNLMDTANPMMIGVVQNQDSYMKGKIAQRHYYDQIPASLQNAMNEFHQLTGRRYSMVENYRMDDAEYALVAMGGASETAMATVDYIREEIGITVGVTNISVFRPFPGPAIVEALKDVKSFSVLERMDNPLAQSNPLTTEIKSAFLDAMNGAPGYPKIDRVPDILSGAGGLGSRDVRPGDFISMVENMRKKEPKRFFVIGIKHDLSLDVPLDPDIRTAGSFSMRGHSVGGYGSVTTNKVIATILGSLDFYVQAYPKYGSEKAGLPTTYYLTISKEPVRTHSELNYVEFVPLNDVNAFHTGNPFAGLQEKGMVFLQSSKTDPQEIWDSIPIHAQEIVRKKDIQVVALDTVAIARDVATKPELQQRMQGIVLLGIFLKSAPFLQDFNMTEEQLFERVESVIRRFWGRHGEQVLADNLKAIRRGYSEVFEIPRQIIEKTSIVKSLPVTER